MLVNIELKFSHIEARKENKGCQPRTS